MGFLVLKHKIAYLQFTIKLRHLPSKQSVVVVSKQDRSTWYCLLKDSKGFHSLCSCCVHKNMQPGGPNETVNL